MASARGFSEWLLYGLYADRVLGADSGHAGTNEALALTYWFGGDVESAPLRSGAIPLAAHQVAIGVQSFIGVPMERLWELFRASQRLRQPLGT